MKTSSFSLKSYVDDNKRASSSAFSSVLPQSSFKNDVASSTIFQSALNLFPSGFFDNANSSPHADKETLMKSDSKINIDSTNGSSWLPNTLQNKDSCFGLVMKI